MSRWAAAHEDRGEILESWHSTSAAAARQVGLADPTALVATQGHVLTVASFVSTLVVEATVHLLDLTLDLPGGPPPEALGHTRVVLAGLLGGPLPGDWDDRAMLGDLTERFPLLG